MIDVNKERNIVKKICSIKEELETNLSNIKSLHKDLSESVEGDLIIQLIDKLSECETKLSNGLDNLENDIDYFNNLIKSIHQDESEMLQQNNLNDSQPVDELLTKLREYD